MTIFYSVCETFKSTLPKLNDRLLQKINVNIKDLLWYRMMEDVFIDHSKIKVEHVIEDNFHTKNEKDRAYFESWKFENKYVITNRN